MPRSSGTYSLPAGNPVVTNTTISSVDFNNTMTDIGSEITNSIPRDGSAPPTSNLPMGGFKLTGLGSGVATTDAATIGSPNFLGTPTAPTAALGTNTTQLATMAAVFAQAASSGLLPRSPRTSNTILAAADAGTFLDYTSGTFTQTITAAATLGGGWWLYCRNSGTGSVTFDPNGGEIIDNDTGVILYPGEAWLLQCDGTAFYIIRLNKGTGGYLTAFEQRAAGTDSSDTAGAGTTITRSINAGSTTIAGSTIGANNVSFSKAGTYLVFGRVPGGAAAGSSGVCRHRASWHNGTSNVLIGSATSAKGDTTNTAPSTTDSVFFGMFAIAGSTTFTVKHSCDSGTGLSGGKAINIGGEAEMYTQIQVWRLS